MPLQVPLDLPTAAVNRMLEFPIFQLLLSEGLIGTDAADDATLQEKVNKAWVFQGLDDDGRPFRDPEGTGTSVVVLSEVRPWSTPNRHNTMAFPTLQMLIYTDSTRHEKGGVKALDARRKCKFLARCLTRCFHLVGNEIEDQIWFSSHPHFRVHSCTQSSSLEIRDVPGTQNATVRGEMKYEVITD